MLLIDKCAYTNKLKDLNTMAKFLFGIVFIFISLINNSIPIFLLIALGMSFIIVVIAKINLKYYLYMLLIPSSFLILSILTILFSISRDSTQFLYHISFNQYYLGVTMHSLYMAKVLFLRSMSCLSCGYFISFTIPIYQLIYVLKKLKISKVFIELFVLIYRFIFIFLDEANEIYTAQHMRFGYINLKNSYSSLAVLIRILLIRVMSRYKDMSIALDSKLYNGEFHI